MKKYIYGTFLIIVYKLIFTIIYTKFNIISLDKNYSIIALVLAPIYEEIIFRYFLLNLQNRYINNKILNILLNSIVFSILHFNIIQLPYTFVLGAILSSLMYKYNSIYLCIFLHLLNNII